MPLDDPRAILNLISKPSGSLDLTVTQVLIICYSLSNGMFNLEFLILLKSKPKSLL